ncbi:MAG TPA: tetratricopeptide repeat protein [Deltaproteobacteria bacterium]|nr:tetratricopeptide repeat protein [Deltaproteobacteria bacterium]
MKTGRARIALVIALLTVLASVAYVQVTGHGFINLDDALYVTDNSPVQGGISVEGVSWAFGFTDRTYWHPLSWLSHMMDCELFGLNAGMHHLTNLLYHTINSILLFLALHLMTGTFWRSAFAAALFAVHPVNADTVAWIAQRKNLLSTLFCLLTLLAYAWYAHRQTFARYLAALSLFVAGLLSKPMIVTLPFAMLLLDYWPLRRIRLNLGVSSGKEEKEGIMPRDQRRAALKLVIEKVPFLFIALLMIHVSMSSVHGHMDVITTDMVSMKLRLENALVSYVHYLGKMIWPWNLTIYYPYPQSIPLAQVLSAGAVIIAVTGAVLAKLRRYPYLAVGWFWYLGALVPVSGIIQAGLWPAIAERWMYVPGIGLFIMVSWGGRDLFSRLKSGRQVYRYASLAVVVLLALLTFRQAGFWKDDFTLFSRAIEVNDRNSLAYGNLADIYLQQGSYDHAFAHYTKALELNPRDSHIHHNFAVALLDMERYSEAVSHLRIAAEKFGHDENLLIGLGTALAKQGDLPGALEWFDKALIVNPHNAQTHFKLAVVLGESGRTGDAAEHYREALRLEPNFEQAEKNLEYTLAVHAYEHVLSLQPDSIQAMERLAIIHSQRGDLPRALYYLQEMLKRDPENPGIHYNLACLYARQGDMNGSLKWLAGAVEKGFSDRGLLESDQDLENIRSTARYRELVNTLGSESEKIAPVN